MNKMLAGRIAFWMDNINFILTFAILWKYWDTFKIILTDGQFSPFIWAFAIYPLLSYILARPGSRYYIANKLPLDAIKDHPKYMKYREDKYEFPGQQFPGQQHWTEYNQ